MKGWLRRVVQVTAKVALVLTAGALVGILGALFLAGPALFADGPANERLAVVAVLCVVLGIVGLVIGLAAPTSSKGAPWVLAAPTVLISVLFAVRESSILATALELIVGSLGFSWAGVLLGARLRLRAKSTDAPEP